MTDPLLGGVTCAATTLAVGANTTCTAADYIILPADVTAGFVENTAEVDSNDPAVPGILVEDTSDPTVQPLGGAAVQLFKTISAVTIAAGANPAITDAGDTITYAFTVNNTGNTALENIVVTDPLLGAVTCAATTLAVGASTTCTAADYTILAADVTAGFVENSAEVDANDPAVPGTLVEDTSDAGDDTVETGDGAGPPMAMPPMIPPCSYYQLRQSMQLKQ